MSEISGITSQTKLKKLTSKPKATFETAVENKEVQASAEFKRLESEMQEIDRGFALMREIRQTLEKLLSEL